MSDTIGRRFRAFGSVYTCLEYNPRKGYLMQLEDEKADFPAPRKRGDTTWISERAINRTYHPIY